MFRKNRSCSDKTVPMLAYWTRLYLLVLMVSLFLLAVISGVWIRINAYNHHYELLELWALQLSETYERAPVEGARPEWLIQDRPGRMRQMRIPALVQIVDQWGNAYAAGNIRGPVPGQTALLEAPPSYRAVMSGQTIREQVKADSQTWLRVGVPLSRAGQPVFALYISSPTVDVLDQVRRLYGSLALITGVIGLAGWLVLYFLSRKLTRPLVQVAASARSIAGGKYDVVLPQRLKERELQQLVTSFGNMAAQLENLERLRTSLLAGVSHELRTPLTSIRGMIQAVNDKVVKGEEAEKFLKISLDEAKRLQKMVDELLDLSSLESGARTIETGEVDLSGLLEDVVRQLTVHPELQDVRLDLRLPGRPVLVRGDAGRLRQVILNLIDNSRKASAGEIRIVLREAGGDVTLDVEDDGKGIPPGVQPYIFERFYRGGDGKEKHRGLGLGLTIGRLLARAHGGDLVLLESSPGGTAFRLTLPGLTEGSKT
ncbi:MAG: HAMP domain-containing histidine kinase [Peptococcaceae bacterium]|nr:HAMP domain-containing histidine kinase [Peptococcaceae bacterium]